MAVVPYNRRRQPVDPLEGVSDAHKLMALGELYQRGMLASGQFEPPPDQPSTAQQMKDYVESKRRMQDKKSGKDVDEEIIPGEEISDPERGPQSGRTVKRL